MNRFSVPLRNVSVASAVSNSGIIDYSGWAGGMVYVPSGSSITELTWYASLSEGETFYPVQDGFGNSVTSSVSGGMSCFIPAECYGAICLKVSGNSSGIVHVSLKS